MVLCEYITVSEKRRVLIDAGNRLNVTSRQVLRGTQTTG